MKDEDESLHLGLGVRHGNVDPKMICGNGDIGLAKKGRFTRTSEEKPQYHDDERNLVTQSIIPTSLQNPVYGQDWR